MASIAAHKSQSSNARASTGGRLFYRDDMSGLNFNARPATIGATLDRLLSLAG